MSTETEQFNQWLQQWDAACAKQTPKVGTPAKNPPNYFGFQNERKDEDGEDTSDAAYWNKLALMATPSEEREQILTEQKKDDKTILGNAAKAMAASPNPIRANTVGKDQDLNPQSLGATYSEQDVEELAEMKVKLHDLECQLNSFEGRGQNAKKFESQIETLKQKIDELSDAMTRTFPYALSPQGD